MAVFGIENVLLRAHRLPCMNHGEDHEGDERRDADEGDEGRDADEGDEEGDQERADADEGDEGQARWCACLCWREPSLQDAEQEAQGIQGESLS